MKELKNWFFLVLLACIWGSSFILIKRGLYTPEGSELFTSIQVGAMRIVIAALFMLPFSLRSIRKITTKKGGVFLIVGVFGNALPAFLFAIAQTEISSALAGMLNALVPLFSLLIAFFIFKVKVRYWQVIGLFMGLVAAIGLVYFSGNGISNSSNNWYALLAVGATLCYAISLNTIKQYLQEESAVNITGLALLLVSPVGIYLLATTGFYSTLTQTPGSLYGFGAIALLAIVGTALALIIFNWLVQETNTIFASSVTYLIPLVAILWGMADGEQLHILQGVCALILLGGIFLINRK